MYYSYIPRVEIIKQNKFTKFLLDMNELFHVLKEFAADVNNIHDAFFDDGNKICGVYVRRGVVDEDDEEFCHQQYPLFQCEIPNCTQEFDTLLKYELHYNSCHRYSCSECKKHLPSPHLLDLHLSEVHDSFFKASAERKPMFRCYVETCDVLSNNANERRSHCIEVHKFPHDFRYDVRKMSKKKKEKVTEAELMETSSVSENLLQEQNQTSDESRITPFIGPFTFGHKRNYKVFNTKKTNKSKPIDLSELKESLPCEETSNL